MELGITNKNVLVTGASQGLGKAIALSFADLGCHVGIIARREKELKEVFSELKGKGHAYHIGDLMKEGGPLKAVAALEKEVGAFDIVVHNVGGVPLHITDALSPVEQWLEVWRFNVGIGIEINNYVIPKMQKRKWGRVVHISSISGDSLRGRPPYAVAKSTLTAYATALGRAVAETGVVVSAIKMGAYTYPGSYWDKTKDTDPAKLKDYLRHHQAIGRLGETKDIVPFILFLSSQHATFATGSAVPVDGGTM